MGTVIRLISTSTIRSPSHDENPDSTIRRIELTPWDLQLLLVGPIQKGLLFRKKPNTDFTALIQHLKSSLSCVLHSFPPLAGRLAADIDEDSRSTAFFIDCNNAGALFVHAEASSISTADILDQLYVPSFVRSLFPLNGIKNHRGDSNPLLGVQVTELADGGIFIGCTINHMVVDGSSFWHFLCSWSEISRGEGGGAILRPPVLNRWFPAGLNPPIRINSRQFPDRSSDFDSDSPLLKERVFLFRKEKVLELKSRANSETEGGGARVSSLQALLAHIWRSVSRSRGLDDDTGQESELRILIGARPRLGLPANYFGNAVQAGVARLKAGELLEGNRGFGKAALEVNRVVAWHSEENLRKFLTAWREKPELLTMEGMTSSSGSGGGSRHGGLVVSSSPRFDVYGNDFGWGKPVAVRSGGGNKHDGKITVFQGREEGSVEVQACLLEETLFRMENDTEFMAAVSA